MIRAHSIGSVMTNMGQATKASARREEVKRCARCDKRMWKWRGRQKYCELCKSEVLVERLGA